MCDVHVHKSRDLIPLLPLYPLLPHFQNSHPLYLLISRVLVNIFVMETTFDRSSKRHSSRRAKKGKQLLATTAGYCSTSLFVLRNDVKMITNQLWCANGSATKCDKVNTRKYLLMPRQMKIIPPFTF